MRFLLSILSLTLLIVGIARAETLSSQAFTDAAAAARAAMPSAQVTVKGDLQLEVRGPGGTSVASDLGNAFELYLRSPQRLDHVIGNSVGALIDTVRLIDAKVDRSRIIAVLKPLQWVDAMQQAAPGILTEPFNTELAIVYAEDRPSSMHFLMASDDVGDRARLHDLALTNLRRLLPKIDVQPDADGILRMSVGGDYEATLLLADDIWSSGEIKVDGDIVVAVPDKSVLFVTGSRNRTGIARLRTMVAKLATGPYALTPALFVYRDGKFVKFDAD
jgi:uncharacterized protein YtpQ (UPF0354 family)